LQNIPVRTDFGRKIRACFGALNAGDVFLSADYSQIELRLLAHLSGDEHLVDAFNSGADFHASTAARVFGVPVGDVTAQMRSRAKAVNFGIVYGQQAFGLAQSLEIPMSEAKEMIDRYFEAYPGVRAYLDDAVDKAKELGYAETMFGRRRHIPELAARNAVQRGFGERTAMNHPMQGSAADIIKMAMNEVARRLVADGFSARLLIQVHDELDFSVPVAEVESLSAMVKDVMENVVELKVPLIADVSHGATWAEAH
jgi:DNA polymerase-1